MIYESDLKIFDPLDIREFDFGDFFLIFLFIGYKTWLLACGKIFFFLYSS